MPTDDEPCEHLPWDTDFFGMEIASVRAGTLTADRSAAIDAWCAGRNIQCLYFVARPDDAATVKQAEDRGYRLVDVRVTMEVGKISDFKSEISNFEFQVLNFKTDDLPALRQIARAIHKEGRFFFDDRFPRGQAEAFYEKWISNSCCDGFAQKVFVVHNSGQPAGYVTCHLADGVGSIGLIGVDGTSRGKGLGRRLVHAAVEWFESQSVSRVSVVTQGRNIAAQRLYARCGFIVRDVELYYHKWFR